VFLELILMFLTPHNVVHFLLTRSQISASSVVHDGCRVEDFSSRNRCFKVSFAQSPGIFVKQARQTDATMKACLEIEAECLRLIGKPESSLSLSDHVLRLISFDRERLVLCTMLVENGHSLRTVQLANPELRNALAKSLGALLATVHTTEASEIVNHLPAAAQHRVPTLLHGRSLATRPEDDPAGVYARIQEYPEYVKLIRDTAGYWQADGLMHGDIRWDNILVSESESGPVLSLIDWELAGGGDVAWDVAGVVQSYLIDWSADLLSTEDLQLVVGTFLSEYLTARHLPDNQTQSFLRKTILYSGCRLVQSTFEQHQFGTTLNSHGLRLLQLSWNILRDPAAAENELLLFDQLRRSLAGHQSVTAAGRA